MTPVLSSALVREAVRPESAGHGGGDARGAERPEGARPGERGDRPAVESRRFTSFAVDSREVEPGALFFALPGEHHHGAEFLSDAAGAGARGAIVPRDRELPDVDLEWFRVEDPLRALGDLAARVRRHADARVVGITGSSGKTTVKEMAAAALAGARDVYRTEGNYNSQIGLPLTILAAPDGADLWVLEMGTNAPGEIARLTEISAPDDAVVTTIGPSHLEELGDEEGVLREKMALVRGAASGGVVVVGERPPVLPRAAREIREETIVAGLGEEADWRPDSWDWGAEHATFERAGVRYRVEAGGEHHLRDALIAAALADAMGIAPERAAGGLSDFRPLAMRGSVRRFGDLTVIEDCYNANPESFSAAIDYCVSAFPGRRLTAAVGSMLELGDRSELAHRCVAAELREAGFGPIVATGDFIPAFESLEAGRNGGETLTAADAEGVARRLVASLRGDEVVLVKASRGERLERVVHRLEDAFGTGGS